MTDKIYAMSSFLQFRAVWGKVRFSDGIGIPRKVDLGTKDSLINIQTSEELLEHLKSYMVEKTADGKAALALSSGIDSVILAKLMPKGSVAYTFKCVVPGRTVTDESIRAREIAEMNGLEHRIIEVFWEDYAGADSLSKPLMRHKNAPIHSIEVQIFKAALQAKRDGFERLIFAEGADMKFGGMDSLLSKDFTLGEFVERYSFVMPYKALKEYRLLMDPFFECMYDGYMDVHQFLQNIFAWVSINSYINPCEVANIEFASPFVDLEHNPIDIARIRAGESKYVVRGVYNQLYPDVPAVPKIPMPRPVNEWFEHWQGPSRPEFWPNCHVNMSGDQKYYIWILEQFLNMIEGS